jgi:nucleoside-diphosphate-sugar epimerase
MSSRKRNTVLILGANGRLGRAAVDAFAANGWEVLAQARRPIAHLPPHARQIGVDLSNTDSIAKAAADASAVIYAVNPVYTEWDTRLLPLAKQGMDIATRIGSLFMLPGNVYAFGEQMPARLVETTPSRPSTNKGEQRAALENEMEARIRHRLHSVVIRAGDFFGCGTGSWLDQAIVKSISSGKLVYPGPLDCAHAWAYLPDLARAFVGVAELHRLGKLDEPVMREAFAHTSPAIGSFTKLHFVGHNVNGETFLTAIERAAARLGIAPKGSLKRGQLPWVAMRIGGIVNPMWREVSRMSYLWRVPHAVESLAFNKLLPTLAPTPLDEAIEAALVELGIGQSMIRR